MLWNMDLWKEYISEHSGCYTVILVDRANRKNVPVVYSGEIMSLNYCSWSSKYSFTTAILIKTELQLSWYHNDVNRFYVCASTIVTNILLCYVSCHYKDDSLDEKLHHFFRMDRFCWIPHLWIIKPETSVSSLMYNSANATNI